ncbi:MAG: MFS transporter [Candidatus Taylorbacteria bacterium]|nr:MFS transporter [Candidatus Taylorbacteria bacterium]
MQHKSAVLGGKVQGTHNHALYTMYLLGFLFSLHSAIPSYVDSSFLSIFGNTFQVSAVFALTSVSSIVGFLASFPLVKKYGNYKMAKYIILGQILCFAGLIFFKNIYLLGPVYVISIMLFNLLFFCSDIFLESASTNLHTGRIRGMYLTLINFAWVLSPSIASSLIVGNEYWRVYAASAGILVLIYYIVQRNFHKFKDPVYPRMSVTHAISKFAENKDLRFLSMVALILNVFYMWMTIYTPLFLIELGFSWADIGIIFTVMLVPFVLIQLPLGKIADGGLGEKEIMITGTVIMAVATGALAFISTPGVLVWAMILFFTRVGAAAVEVMTETYFFKKIHTRDSNILSVYRLTKPAAYLITPILFLIITSFISVQSSFIVLGIICLIAVPFAFFVKDTA